MNIPLPYIPCACARAVDEDLEACAALVRRLDCDLGSSHHLTARVRQLVEGVYGAGLL